jgi:hypothetical protein
VNPTIRTRSGISFNLIDPDPALINILDIAHALAHICRFTGHTHSFYSVAEHSVRCSLLPCVPPEHALETLLHDAAEAYIGDVSSPLKAQLREYQLIEFRIEQAIRKRFCLPPKKAPCVKQADLTMLATEKRDLMFANDEQWDVLDGIKPMDKAITVCYAPHQAEVYFLDRYAQLSGAAQ